MTRLRDIYGPGFTRAEYLRALAAGYQTGWWDHNGVPAPWPDNYDDAYQQIGNDVVSDDTTEPRQNGDEPPF
jgi:hypothetical protein